MIHNIKIKLNNEKREKKNTCKPKTESMSKEFNPYNSNIGVKTTAARFSLKLVGLEAISRQLMDGDIFHDIVGLSKTVE